MGWLFKDVLILFLSDIIHRKTWFRRKGILWYQTGEFYSDTDLVFNHFTSPPG